MCTLHGFAVVLMQIQTSEVEFYPFRSNNQLFVLFICRSSSALFSWRSSSIRPVQHSVACWAAAAVAAEAVVRDPPDQKLLRS